MTKTEQIVAAIAAKLTAAGVPNRSDTANPYSFEDTIVLIDCGNEQPNGVLDNVGFVYWDLTISLWIIAQSGTPKLAPEVLRAAAHIALYADRSLGGLIIDIQAGSVNRQIDQENPAAGITEAQYQIQYRALENVL